MAWIRTGVFISLTLVATTLPAGGTSAPAPAPDSTGALPCSGTTGGLPASGATGGLPSSGATGGLPASAATGGPAPRGTNGETPTQPRQTPADSGLLLQAASQMDVWKSAPTRPLGNSGPLLVAIPGQATPAVWKPSPSAGQDLQSNAARVHQHAREWLTCRYPHAPPALA